MTRYGIVADVHLANHGRFGGSTLGGINRRCTESLGVLALAMAEARAKKCVGLTIAGDLFDTVKPEPQIIAAAQSILTDDPHVIVMLGNHEQVSNAPGDHALGPMAPISGVISEPRMTQIKEDKILHIPYQSGSPDKWLPEALKEFKEECEGALLILHMGIADDSTQHFLAKSGGCIHVEALEKLCKQYRVAAVVSGDWHAHKIFQGRMMPIVQIGALVPTGFDNSGIDPYGKLVIWDFKKKELEVVDIPGPRFLPMPETDVLPKEAFSEKCPLYVRISASKEAVSGCVATLNAWKKEGRVIDGEVILDDAQVRVATKSAASTARSAATLDESLSGFVSHMDLPEGVERQSVLALAKKYLGA